MSATPAGSREIRGFRAGDGPPLVTAWCRSAPADPITPDRFRTLVLLDANFDPEGLRVAVAGGRLLGAAYAVRRLTPLHGTDLERSRAGSRSSSSTPPPAGRDSAGCC